MYFHHSLTDQELIRAADSTENPAIRFMADRLATRRAQLDKIRDLTQSCTDNLTDCKAQMDAAYETATDD